LPTGAGVTIPPKVSVVIPTHNRLDRLRRVLAAFATQSFGVEQFEVVVVSDGSTDGTDAYLGDVQMPFDLVFASQANAGPAAARNHAARLARGDLLLFVDDDVVAESDLIEQHVQTHDHHGTHVVVIGPMLTPSDYRPRVLVRWEQAMLYKQYEAMKRGDYAPTYRQFHTGNASVDRRFFLDAGGFDERFRRAEDVEFAYRLSVRGAQFVFNPSAVGNHYAERSFDSWIGIARDYGRNDVVFDREAHPRGALDTARREFAGRHLLIQWLTRGCVGRPLLESSLHWPGRGVAAVGDRLGWHGVSRSALSGLYNTSYYCGMAEELGGRQAFWDLIDAPAAVNPHPEPARP
jgi:GT2 family glycosyltransferase